MQLTALLVPIFSSTETAEISRLIVQFHGPSQQQLLQ